MYKNVIHRYSIIYFISKLFHFCEAAGAHRGPLDFLRPSPVAVTSPRVVTVEESGGGFVERVRYGRFGGRGGAGWFQVTTGAANTTP